MDAQDICVLEWLHDVHPSSPGADIVPGDASEFIKKIPMPLRSEANFTLPPPRSKHDKSRCQRNEDGMKLFPTHDDQVYRDVPEGPLARASGHPDMTRMRELGLVAPEDSERASAAKVTYRVNADDNTHRDEKPWLPATRLVKQERFDFGSKLTKEPLVSPSSSEIDDFCQDILRQEDKVDQDPDMPSDPDPENLDCSHATAPYPKETRRLSLVTAYDNDGEKSHITRHADGVTPADFHVHSKSHWHLIGLSLKPTRIMSVDLGANGDVQAQKPTNEGECTVNPLRGQFKSQKPRFSRAYPILPPGKLLHGFNFELTPSEASVDTVESFCSGDGKFVEFYDTKAGKMPEIQGAARYPTAQTAQVEGSYGQDGDIQIPIFPYEHLTTRCRGPNCPIKGKHEKGPYLHKGKLRAREGNIFGSSNPPQEIWDAYDRIKDEDGSLGGKRKDKVAARDVKLVTRFARLHFGEASEWGVGEPEGGDAAERLNFA